MIKITGVDAVILEARKKLHEESEKAKLKVVNKLVSDLKEATPVDTGFARDSWRVEEGAIVNDAEYIAELNQGSSAQAPANFIEITVLSENKVRPNGVIVRET